ncbi:MAG: hypothetical protein QME62_06150 [Armatimonadota bacterium]|nr:hypothetical protein [Armatimonadota bacterium]
MIRCISLSILATCLLGLATVAFAVGQPGDVIIGQEVVLRIRFPAGGYSVEERAEIVTQRINELLGSHPFEASDVKVAVCNKEYAVFIGGNLIITADKETAKFNKTTPEKLANIWAENLRRVIPKAKAQPR